ncbi:TRAP transporter substrate-binding protein [Chloroflexota bacterium]
MRKFKVAFMLGTMGILVLVSLLAGCSPQTEMEPVLLRYSGGAAPSHHATIAQNMFAEEVGKRLGGAINVQVYHSAELYSHREVADAVVNGAVEMGWCSGGHWGGRTPLFGFYNYIGMVQDMDHLLRAKEQLSDLLNPYFEQQGVKVLYWIGYGHNLYAGNYRVIEPQDLDGRLIRGMNSATNAFLEAMGATPAALALSEVYDALDKGAIDGAMTGWANLYTQNYAEVADYVITPLSSPFFMSFINLNVWNSLPKDAQKEIMEVVQEVETFTFETAEHDDQIAIQDTRQKAEVIIMTPEQIAVWEEMGKSTWDLYIEECEKAGYGDTAREVMRILDETR